MKTSDLLIDTVAFVSKVKVENSSLSEIRKEFTKFGIDFGKELLKDVIKTPKEKILNYVKLYGIQKIEVDIYYSNSYCYAYFHILGRDYINFCNMLGIKVLSQSENQILKTSINNNNLIHILHDELSF